MKHVLVTGGAGGIGSAIVKTFIENGCFVYIADTDADAARVLAAQYGAEVCEAVVLDVTDAAAIARYTATLDDTFVLDHIVTLAGRALEGEWEPFEAQSLETIEGSLRLNLLGHIQIVHAFLPYLKRAAGDKSVALISSINAMEHFGLPAYSAAKAGLAGFMHGVLGEFGKDGIRINTISPGTVITPATQSEPKDFDKLLATTAMHRFVTAADVAKLVFAVCNDFVGMTGQNVVLDAGQSKIH